MNNDVPLGEPPTPDAAFRTLVAESDEQGVVSLLVARFRSFIALGYPETEALLAAVGYTA